MPQGCIMQACSGLSQGTKHTLNGLQAMVQIVAEGPSSKDVAAVWHISLGKKRQRKQAAKDSNDRVKTN